MPRPISWLPRLHRIRRAVETTVRSHYDRKDLQQLFEIQPRSAQLLYELLPTVRLGRSLLVEREVLAQFLERITLAEDVTAEIEAIRMEKPAASRRKLRYVVTEEVAAASVASLPPNIQIERGRIEVRFDTVQELAQSLHALALALDGDLEQCIRQWEPTSTRVPLPV